MTMKYIVRKESESSVSSLQLQYGIMPWYNIISQDICLHQSCSRYLEVDGQRIVYFTQTSTNRIDPECRFTSNVIPGVVVSEEKTDEHGATFVEVEPIRDPQLRKTLEERLKQEVPEADQPAYYW